MIMEYRQAPKSTYILVMISMCGLMASTVGLVNNISGLFFTPIATEFNALIGSVSLSLTICNIVFSLGGMFVARIFKKVSVKSILISGTIVLIVSTVLLASAKSMLALYLLNAIRGFASGMLGFVIVTTIMNLWFMKNSGLLSSIVLGCSGIAGAVFSPVVSSLIESYGWRQAYVFVGIITLVLHLPSIFFVPSLDPHQKGYYAYGELEMSGSGSGAAQNEEYQINWLPFILVCILSITACASTALGQHLPGIADSYGLAGSVGTMILSLSMITNTGGKVLFGALADKIGSIKTIFVFEAAMVIGYVFLLFVPTSLGMNIGATLYGFAYGLSGVGTVVVTKDIFGVENYARTYPTFDMLAVVAYAAFSSIIGYMYDFSGGYTSSIILMLVFVIIYALIGSILYLKKKVSEA